MIQLINDEYSCNDLDLLSKELKDIKLLLLTRVDEAGMDPMAEIEYQKALSHFEQAALCLKAAALHQARAIA